MKIKISRKCCTPFFLITMSVGLMLAQSSFAATRPVHHLKLWPGDVDPAKKTKNKSGKSFSSLNNNSVKIFPDALKRTMHVVAKENEGREVDFFVFDLQGTLIQNYKMKAKDHIRIEGLQRGSYVYRVFLGDEETASGNFEIK